MTNKNDKIIFVRYYNCGIIYILLEIFLYLFISLYIVFVHLCIWKPFLLPNKLQPVKLTLLFKLIINV